jgi:hypothetical protein
LNISSNPWSFTSSDVLTATIAASPTGLVSSAGGIVALTTSAAHGLSTTVQQWVTLIGTSPVTYIGFYKVLAVPTTTTATLYSDALRYSQTVLAAGGGGTMILNQYNNTISGQDMSWLNANAANDQVIVYDKNGNLVWNSIAPTKGTYSRAKPHWFNGLSISQISSGTLMVSVD